MGIEKEAAVSLEGMLGKLPRSGRIGGRKLVDLARLETVLDEMLDGCDRGEVPDCPFIDALFEG